MFSVSVMQMKRVAKSLWKNTTDITMKKTNVGPASLCLCVSPTAPLLLQSEVLTTAEQGCVYHCAMLIKCSFNYLQTTAWRLLWETRTVTDCDRDSQKDKHKFTAGALNVAGMGWQQGPRAINNSLMLHYCLLEECNFKIWIKVSSGIKRK